MAIAVSQQIAAKNFGYYTVTNVTLDNSYASGGEELSAEQLGLASVDFAICIITNGSEAEATPADTAYYTPQSGATAGKIHLINSKTSAEIASTSNMEKVKVQIVAFGSSKAK